MENSHDGSVLAWLYESCGPLYSVALFFSICGLMLAVFIVLLVARSRRPLWVMLAFSFLPLFIGCFGTLHGKMWLARHEAELDDYGQALSETERRRITSANWVTTYVGGMGTLPIAFLSLVGLAVKRDRTVPIAAEIID